jgi:putative restriction endonuclease
MKVRYHIIVLRSDLHILFDRGLLAVHPETFTVHLATSVRKDDYRALEGRKLRERVDGKDPDAERLRERWEKKGW